MADCKCKRVFVGGLTAHHAECSMPVQSTLLPSHSSEATGVRGRPEAGEPRAHPLPRSAWACLRPFRDMGATQCQSGFGEASVSLSHRGWQRTAAGPQFRVTDYQPPADTPHGNVTQAGRSRVVTVITVSDGTKQNSAKLPISERKTRIFCLEVSGVLEANLVTHVRGQVLRGPCGRTDVSDRRWKSPV